jgi:hypothetical protein
MTVGVDLNNSLPLTVRLANGSGARDVNFSAEVSALTLAPVDAGC